MRLLRINNIDIDIDENTSIGIDIQAYDIKDSLKQKFNVSNSFSIPKTTKNLAALNFGSNVNINDTSIYDKYSVNYWVYSYQLITNGYCYIQNVAERINLIVVDKKEFWEEIKDPSYNLKLLNDYALLNLNLPTKTNVAAYDFEGFINRLLAGDWDIELLFYFSNFLNISDSLPYALETQKNLTLGTELSICLTCSNFINVKTEAWNVNGNHFSITYLNYFKLIEKYFDVNLNTGENFYGNLFNDEIFLKMSVPVRTFGLTRKDDGYYFSNEAEYNLTFPKPFVLYPYTSIEFGKDNSIYDFITSVFKQFNVFIKTISDTEFKIYRFDKLESYAEIIDFSGMITGVYDFKPLVQGFSQSSFIKWNKVYKGGDSYSNSKKIVCKNKNIDLTKDLFTISGYVPSLLKTGVTDNEFSLNLSTEEEALKNNVFLINSGVDTINDVIINFSSETNGIETISKKLKVASIYDLNSEYQLISKIMEYPKFYEIKKWLSVPDVMNFDFFRLYWIQELNASFFVNKISGFNPDKSKEPVTIELIKVNETPALVPKAEMWVDGFGNPFVDGEENIFY